MKSITKLFFLGSLALCSLNSQAQCVDYTSKGQEESGYYKILDIKASELGSSGIPSSNVVDGSATTDPALHGSGVFQTSILDGINDTPTDVTYPVTYYKAVVAPTLYSSAYTKIEINGVKASGTDGLGAATDACFGNNNTIYASDVYSNPGYIELCRAAAAVDEPEVSRHGYIQIDNLPAVERIHWSFSSTAWKRGVKLDIKRNGGEWEPLRWEPSDISTSFAGFAEQGYDFEEIIGDEEDPDSRISLRFRIWDGDTTYLCNQGYLGYEEKKVSQTPLLQHQVVRIHQITVYSGVTGAEVNPTNISVQDVDNFNIIKRGNAIVLSSEANVEVYTIDGVLVKKEYAENVDISDMVKGTYLVKAIAANGVVKTKKIVL